MLVRLNGPSAIVNVQKSYKYAVMGTTGAWVTGMRLFEALLSPAHAACGTHLVVISRQDFMMPGKIVYEFETVQTLSFSTLSEALPHSLVTAFATCSAYFG